MSLTKNARRVTHAALILLLAIAGLSATSTAASADPVLKGIRGDGTTRSCARLTLCVYVNNDFKLDGIGVQGGDLGLASLASGNKNFNDTISSIVNNSSSAYCFWQDINFSGLAFQIHGGEIWKSVPFWINDQISSWSVGQCF